MDDFHEMVSKTRSPVGILARREIRSRRGLSGAMEGESTFSHQEENWVVMQFQKNLSFSHFPLDYA